MKVALFVTCFNDTMFPESAKATVELLERLGVDVDFPAGQTCCGQMHINTGYRAEAVPLVRRYVETFEGYDAVVAPSASCAGTGAAFAFLSPILGWLGTAVTGSDTSANALFATLQQTAAEKAGLDPTLLVAANTSGGVVGKMISPQNLTIAATSVGIVGRESDLFRKTILWSVGLLAVLCLLIGLQSTPVLGWMLP